MVRMSSNKRPLPKTPYDLNRIVYLEQMMMQYLLNQRPYLPQAVPQWYKQQGKQFMKSKRRVAKKRVMIWPQECWVSTQIQMPDNKDKTPNPPKAVSVIATFPANCWPEKLYQMAKNQTDASETTAPTTAPAANSSKFPNPFHKPRQASQGVSGAMQALNLNDELHDGEMFHAALALNADLDDCFDTGKREEASSIEEYLESKGGQPTIIRPMIDAQEFFIYEDVPNSRFPKQYWLSKKKFLEAEQRAQMTQGKTNAAADANMQNGAGSTELVPHDQIDPKDVKRYHPYQEKCTLDTGSEIGEQQMALRTNPYIV